MTPAQQEDLIEDIDDLTPGGATNIRDALLDALSQISSEPTRAATQVAVLLSDGEHNSPLFSVAESAIPAMRENGMVVYALGVGEPNEVDLPTLDQLANSTGGRSYAVGTAAPNEIETAMVEIHSMVRGGIIDSLPIELSPADDLQDDSKLKRWLDRDRRLHAKRPDLEDLAGQLGMKLRDGQPIFERSDRAVVLPVLVEQGASRLWVTLLHPDDHDVWLYLVDPNGKPVALATAGHLHRRSRAPHEFSIIADPMAGMWSVVLLRPQPGPAIRCHMVASLEHPVLRTQVRGAASATLGTHVAFTASAHFELPLTGLRVRGRLRSPSGNLVDFNLDDATGEGDGSGRYQGGFSANEVGLYRGHVEVIGRKNSPTGAALARVLHLDEKDTGLSLKSSAPDFRRRTPVQVLVRKPGSAVIDDEREQRHIDRNDLCGWSRPKKLRSAKRPSRRQPR